MMATTKLYTVLAALLVATACAARPRTVGEPLSDAEAYAMAADASMDLEGMAVGSGVWADVASGKNCSLYCNGKKVTPEEDAVQLGSNKTQVYSCWGTFKAFCKGKKDGEACFAGGVKCEGHWLYIKPVCNARVAVCAGSVKRFHAVGFKKDGRRLAVIKAGGCLGKSAFALAPPSNESRGADLRAWPAEMPQMWAGAYDGPHAALVQSLLGSGDAKTLAKGTCEGLGGGVTVIKKAGCGSSASGFTADGCVTDGGEAGYTALEGRVDAAMGEVGVAVPPEPSLMPTLDLAALLRGGPKCSITCNGKPAWFGGKLPCLGRLEVDCDINTPKGELEFSGACKGFWSGIFGARCAGFTSAHTEFKDYDKYGFCAGKHGMFVKKGKRGFAFGGGCKGKGLFALQKDEDDE